MLEAIAARLGRLLVLAALLFLATTTIAVGQFREDMHSKLLAGENVFFDQRQPRETRTIKAEWIRDAAEKNVPINILGAVVLGNLDLSYHTFNTRVKIVASTFENNVDFSYSNFKNESSFSGEFKNGANFEGANFQNGAGFGGAFTNANFNGITVNGVFEATQTEFTVGATFQRAKFGGDVRFTAAKFLTQANFDLCEFRGNAAFSQADFSKSVTFEQAHFWAGAGFGGLPSMKQLNAKFQARAVFDRAIFDYIADFRGVTFEEEVSFRWTKSNALITFEGALFKKDVEFFQVELSDVNFDGSAFRGKASFEGTHVTGAAGFGRSASAGVCRFYQPVNFADVEIGIATFGRYTEFKGPVVFDAATFGDTSGFLDVDFDSSVEFADTRFTGTAVFRGVVFHDKADFRFARFEGTSVFGSSPLRQLEFEKDTSFSGAVFERGLTIVGAKFLGETYFVGTKFRSSTTVITTEFHSSADFRQAQLQGPAYFGSEVRTEPAKSTTMCFSSVNFNYAIFENDAHFEGARFEGSLSLRGTQFKALWFSPTGQVDGHEQFSSTIDLRGAVYDRIETDWKALLINSNGGRRQEPYDRQPYVQLQQALKSAGLEGPADDVYLEQMKNETHARRWNSRWYYLIYGKVFNYGVGARPWLAVALIFALGAILFSLPGATTSERYTGATLLPRIWAGMGLSFRYLLPFNLPFESAWKPRGWAVHVANSIRLIGWILIPILVLIVTGVIHRSPK